MSKASQPTPNKPARTILGIDPGTHRVGYGLVSYVAPSSFAYVEAGILPVRGGASAEALQGLRREVAAVIRRSNPAAVGVERLFFAKNRSTAIGVSHARGVILLASAECGVPVVELSPNEVKAGITGYGLADKRAVAKMVRLMLRAPALKVIDDATDALAIAIMAARSIPGTR